MDIPKEDQEDDERTGEPGLFCFEQRKLGGVSCMCIAIW